jgi:methyl-accepting chemotaxis protein
VEDRYDDALSSIDADIIRLSAVFSQSLSRPSHQRDFSGYIEALSTGLAALSEGDLTHRLTMGSGQLAENSMVATKEITKLIQRIQTTVSEAVQAMLAMHESVEEVENWVLQVAKSGQSFGKITKSVHDSQASSVQIVTMAGSIQALSDDLNNLMDNLCNPAKKSTAFSQNLAGNSGEVSHTFERVSELSKNNSAALEEISASTAELNAHMAQVNIAAQSLSDMAHSMNSRVARFKLDTTAG